MEVDVRWSEDQCLTFLFDLGLFNLSFTTISKDGPVTPEDHSMKIQSLCFKMGEFQETIVAKKSILTR